MSVAMPNAGPVQATQAQSSSQFDQYLDSAKSGKILADYMNSKGKKAINLNELKDLASNKGGNVPADVVAAAAYMVRHEAVFTAIETHDVARVDGLSGVWNFEWAAQGGMTGSAEEGLARMSDVFDRAISMSAEVTKVTTEKKASLDASKQRPQ